jgi:hypothetical protein
MLSVGEAESHDLHGVMIPCFESVITGHIFFIGQVLDISIIFLRTVFNAYRVVNVLLATKFELSDSQRVFVFALGHQSGKQFVGICVGAIVSIHVIFFGNCINITFCERKARNADHDDHHDNE